MILEHTYGLFTHPKHEWHDIHDHPETPTRLFFNHTLILALIPAVCWYFGTTQVGWTVGDGDPVKLSADSALVIAILSYFAMIGAVFTLGVTINWMAQTYGAESTLSKGIAVASYTATPLFLAGFFGLYPVVWLDLTLGLAAVSASVYLLISGIPIIMDISKEQGVFFAVALMAAATIGGIILLVATILLWDMGAAPVFVS